MPTDTDSSLLDPPSRLPTLFVAGLIALGVAVIIDHLGWLASFGLTSNVLASLLSIPLVVAVTLTFVERRELRLRQKRTARGLFKMRSMASDSVEQYRSALFDAFGIEAGERHERAAALEQLSTSGEGASVDIGNLMRLVALAKLVADIERDFAQQTADFWGLPEGVRSISARLMEISRLLMTCQAMWARSEGDGTRVDLSPRATSASIQLLATTLQHQIDNVDEMTKHAAWSGNRAGYDWVRAQMTHNS